MTTWAQRKIDAGGLSLCALERSGAGPAVLMLHGWLDHAYSFDFVADALPADFRLIALDFRGHGRSDPLPAGSSHSIVDHLGDVEACVRALALKDFHLVGHSLGGSISALYASARPKLPKSLTLIESLGPSGGGAERAVSRLQDFVDDLFKPSRKRVYPSIEAAATRLAEANSSYSASVALHMVKHGSRLVEGGVELTFDPRLKLTSGMTFDEAQLTELFSAISVPVQVIHGTHAMVVDDAQMQARLKVLRARPPIAIEGSHHVHLDQPVKVAAEIARFVRELA